MDAEDADRPSTSDRPYPVEEDRATPSEAQMAEDLVQSMVSQTIWDSLPKSDPLSGMESVLSKDEIGPDDLVAPIDAQPWIVDENPEIQMEAEAAWLRSMDAQPLSHWYDPMLKPALAACPPGPADTASEALVPLADKEIWKADAWKAELKAARTMREAHLYAHEARTAAISEVWYRKREDIQERRGLENKLQAEREQMTAKLKKMEEEVEQARRDADMRVAQAHQLAEKHAAEAEERVQQVREECQKAIAAAKAQAAEAERTAAAHVAAADQRVAQTQAWAQAAKLKTEEDASAEVRRANETVKAARTETLERTQNNTRAMEERIDLALRQKNQDRERHEQELLAAEQRLAQDRSDEALRSEATLRRSEECLARSKKIAAGCGTSAVRALSEPEVAS